jgi:Spy/CpxP family protein refolding chaperone
MLHAVKWVEKRNTRIWAFASYLQKEDVMTRQFGMIVVCIAGLFAAPLYAVQDSATSGCCCHRHHGLAALGLTQAQQDQLKQQRKDMREKMKAGFEASNALREKMKDEFLKAKPDQAVLDGYAEQMVQQHKQMIKNRIANTMKMKQILTQEQFRKVLAMQGKRVRGFRHDGRHGY